eukprot:gene5807-6046_t
MTPLLLLLQTARYLLKGLLAARAGKAPPGGSTGYLARLDQELSSKCPAKSMDCWADPVRGAEVLQAACGGPGAQLAFEGSPWNSSTVAQIAAAKAHCEMVLLQTFMQTLDEARAQQQLMPATLAVLGRCCCLFGLGLLEAGAADLLEAGWLTGGQAAALRAQHRQLLVSLRPEAVGLVDAFGWEDYALNSALGRSDGDVYKALLDMATVSPLNRTEAGPAWETVLKPVMHRKPLPKL